MTKLREEDVMAADVMQRHGASVRSLARQFEVDESTLRYRLNRLRSGAEDGRRQQAEACSPHHEVIVAWLRRQEESSRPAPVKELYEELIAEHGYEGSYKAVVRYVRRRRTKPRIRPHRRVEVRPGTQAQVDWVETTAWIESLGGLVTLSAFVMVLSHSRAWAVIWSLGQDRLAWIRCHNEAFQRLGGVPTTIRLDNLKTGVARGAGPTAEINEGYASYAKQLAFIPDPTRARAPRDKGKVERKAKDAKRLPILQTDRFLDLEHLQEETDRRVQRLAGELLCPVTGETVAQAGRREKEALTPLPPTMPIPFDVQVHRTVSPDCLVTFDGKSFSVPFAAAGRVVQVRRCADIIEVWLENRCIKTVPRHVAAALLIDQSDYEGESTPEVMRPTPLGEIGRSIVMEQSWKAPTRPLEQYTDLVARLR